MTSAIVELVIAALAAMLSPTTLTFSVLALVLGERPLRTGVFFYAGALGATLAIGVVAAFVLGNAAIPASPNTPKTWVAILDVALALALLAFVVRALRRGPNPRRAEKMIDQMSRLASSPAVAVVGAGATLANPGGFIPIALKDVSELNPSGGEFIVLWLGFALISLAPLLLALIALKIAPEQTQRVLHRARGWLERRGQIIAAVLVVLLAVSLLRSGVAGLAS